MPRKLPFVKYTSYGNNFVILDETGGKLLSEKALAAFADQATDINFGVGADNLLVIQKCTRSVLAEINDAFHYWKEVPDIDAEYVFRMFEPNGDEALCCGNGLMCIAHYLKQEYGVNDSTIVTEIPLQEPTVTLLGAATDAARNWVNLGIPRRLPESIVGPEPLPDYGDDIQKIVDMKIKFRQHDLAPYSNELQMTVNGYVVFTGEPHMVVFLDHDGLSVPGLLDVVFADSKGNRGAGPIFRQRIRFGTWLLDRVGYYINTHYRKLFPIGMSVSFVRTGLDGGVIEYRCYERGINKETLACGTGAMAVAYITSKVLGVDESEITILPHRCRWFKPDADIRIEPQEEGWVLNGQPQRIMEAVFLYQE